MPDFIPGLQLSEHFYHEAVQPIIVEKFPALRHTAALLGSGSEVLGFDTPMSTDHNWGPRLILFLTEVDYSLSRDEIHETLRRRLPTTFRGYQTNFSSPNPNDSGVRLQETAKDGLVNHFVDITTVGRFFRGALNVDPFAELEANDWLTFSSQRLRAVTAGKVYHDDLDLNATRQKFSFYPHDVWLYLLAAGWTRISQEEPFVGRTGFVGDDIGSQIITTKLVRDVMRLCFLMERQYAPYPKWFGTAFSRLACAEQLTPLLRAAMLGENWQEREEHLSRIYTALAEKHNALSITEALPTQVSSFHDRPFQVIHGDVFADAIRGRIIDETVKRISVQIGSIDQFSDSTDLLDNIGLRDKLKTLYQ